MRFLWSFKICNGVIRSRTEVEVNWKFSGRKRLKEEDWEKRGNCDSDEVSSLNGHTILLLVCMTWKLKDLGRKILCCKITYIFIYLLVEKISRNRVIEKGGTTEVCSVKDIKYCWPCKRWWVLANLPSFLLPLYIGMHWDFISSFFFLWLFLRFLYSWKLKGRKAVFWFFLIKYPIERAQYFIWILKLLTDLHVFSKTVWPALKNCECS